MDDWNAYIGNIWAQALLQIELKKDSVLVEVAPGGTDKIGRGLQRIGWSGTIYVVEPHDTSREKTCAAYRALLPDAKVHEMAATLSSAPIPECDALISNHPLDDMIIASTLEQKEFEEFFTDHYDCTPEKTRALWQERRSCLHAALNDTVDAWAAAIPKAKHTIIAQYKSAFFTQHGIDEPDHYAYIALRLLASRFNGKAPEGIEGIDDKSRWLVITQETQR